MTIQVQYPGFFTTIQDEGRPGFARYGVPASGPMDRFAFLAANKLVNNEQGMALLEISIDGPQLYFHQNGLIALTGSGFSLMVNQREMPSWTAVFVPAGSLVQVSKTGIGNWAYLAVNGGLQVEKVMDSASTYIRGKMGGLNGQPLQEGQVIKTGLGIRSPRLYAGRELEPPFIPQYKLNPQIHVIEGPQHDRFSEYGLKTFYQETYKLSTTSDRMGYRFSGEKIEHKDKADILTDGMVFGSIQVPASGQPIVMMSEYPTTGGYTKIATVCKADLPLLAQCVPGESQVQFVKITVAEAQKRWIKMLRNLETGMILEDEYFGFQEILAV